jgi:hypothetical protein
MSHYSSKYFPHQVTKIFQIEIGQNLRGESINKAIQGERNSKKDK